MMFRSSARAPRNRGVLSFLGWVLPSLYVAPLVVVLSAHSCLVEKHECTTLLPYPAHYDNIGIRVTTLTRREIWCRKNHTLLAH